MTDARETIIATIGDLLAVIEAHREVWRDGMGGGGSDEDFNALPLHFVTSLPGGQYVQLEGVMMLEASEDSDRFALIGDWPSA